jgi:polyisoprenoid-binding protein YceI
VTLDASFYGHRFNGFAGRHMMGFSARTTIKRSDWGVANWAGSVGDDVEIIVEAEFQKV